MPEREFEIYLSLMTKLLRLSAQQREAIADELRDHLQERMDELTGQGFSREDAVRRALDEFGDTAAMAADFTQISKRKSRRFLMRLTVGSIAVTALVILVATAFWPAIPHTPAPPNALAQGSQPKSKLAGKVSAPGRTVSTTGKPAQAPQLHPVEAAIEMKLATPLKEIKWEDKPLDDLLMLIGQQIKADILVDRKFFDENGIDLKNKVTLVLSHTKISARTALELILERAEADGVAITFREGLIYLTCRETERETVVYNCRDLIDAAAMTMSARPKAGGTGFFSLPAAQLGGLGGGPVKQAKAAAKTPDRKKPNSADGVGGPKPPANQQNDAAVMLLEIIQSTVRSTPWEDVDGTGATICVFNGLVVISANHDAHRETRELLEMLRKAAAEKTGRTAPGKKKSR